MNWKLERVNWHKTGNCWTWWRLKTFHFYSGNQFVLNWGRIALTFERKVWQNR